VADDAATRRTLKLTHALTGGRFGHACLSVMDQDCNGRCAALLERRISSPSRVL